MPCKIKNPANYELGDLESHIHGMYDHFDTQTTIEVNIIHIVLFYKTKLLYSQIARSMQNSSTR